MDVAAWGAIGTGASAIIALSAMVVTVWQARIAKDSSQAAIRSAEASSDQAHSARDAATSARKSTDAAITQALAAVEQVRLLSAQVDAAAERSDKRDAPVFKLTIMGDREVGQEITETNGTRSFVPIVKNNRVRIDDWVKRCHLELLLVSGLSEVFVELAVDRHLSPHVHVAGNDTQRMVRGSVRRFSLVLPYRAAAAHLVIHSSEVGSKNRRWTSHEAVSL